MMCREHLAGVEGPVFVLNGDIPLVRSTSLAGLLSDQVESGAACVIGSAVTDGNEGLGRIVRDSSGAFLRIVEHKDATPSELAIREINTGSYAFDGPALFWALDHIRPNNVQKEYYLTDCPTVLKEAGRTVVASPRFDFREAMGVNTRAQLADVERSIQRDTQQALMAEGVTIVAPEMTYIDPRRPHRCRDDRLSAHHDYGPGGDWPQLPHRATRTRSRPGSSSRQHDYPGFWRGLVLRGLRPLQKQIVKSIMNRVSEINIAIETGSIPEDILKCFTNH